MPKQSIVSAFWIASVISYSLPITAEETFSVQEAPFTVIDTGIEADASWGGQSGAWLDEDRFIANTFKDSARPRPKGKEAETADQMAVIYDLRNRKITPLFDAGRINCHDQDRRLVGVTLNDKSKGKKVSGLRSVSDDGVIADTDVAQELQISPGSCKFLLRDRKTYASDWISYLRLGDGYIERGDTRNSVLTNATILAVLHQPDRPPKELSVRGADVQADVIYLRFLNQYQLNSSDPRTYHSVPGGYECPAEDPGGKECTRRHHKRNEIPFRLMSMDGQISEVRYPDELADWLGGWQMFGKALVTRAGLLVFKTGEATIRSESGLFLITKDQTRRIWGKNRDFLFRDVLSPDGCKLAFLSYGRRFFSYTDQTIKIIDLCKGATH